MPYCAVLVCKNDSRYKNITHGGISYHRFPKDPFQKEKWIDATGRQNWMPTKTSTICSEHFIENDISITPKGLRCLNTMAVPTQKIVTVINLTDEGTSMSSNLLKKREADFSAAGDEIGPCKKKTCRTSIDPSQGIVQDLPGPSRARDRIELTNEGSSISSSLPKKRGTDFSAEGDEIEPCKKKTCRTSIDTSQEIVQDLPGPSRKRDLIEVTNEGSSMSYSLPKKRGADFSAEGDEIEPCKKKTCRTSIDTSQEIVQDLSGPSRKRDRIEVTNEGSSMSYSLPKKREADFSAEGDEIEPLKKKTCKTSIDTIQGIVQDLPVHSRKRDRIEVDDYQNAIIHEKKPRIADNATAHVFKKRAVEVCEDIIPPKKKRVSDTTMDCHDSSKNSRMDDVNMLVGSTYSTPRKLKLSAMLRWTKNKIKNQTLKIKRLQAHGRRIKRKLVKVEDILKEVKEKFAMANENLTSLQNLNVQVQDLIGRQVANVKASVISKKKYSPALRSFALTLNYYSPKAYEYVRRVFNTSLPHPRTLKKWYSKIGGEPGFTKEAFAALKSKADSSTSQLIATLVIDEMSIRRRIEWDGQKLHGYVNMGTGLEGDHLAEAKEALVFLITAINSNFKVPVGFFLVGGVTGVQRAELVKQCLQMANSAGIRIVALTFDGCAANVSMAGHLGCCIQDNKIKFDHPVTHEPVVAVLDPCHMIKLIRNAFENYQIFLDADGNQIKWTYLEQLNNLQYAETFHLANKLKDRHIHFKNERMKVKLATQLFSLSVAESIKFCREDLKLENFKLSQPTEKFLVVFNNLFDIFNSKNLHQYGFKKALSKNNANSVFEFLTMAFQYVSTLRLTDGTYVIKSLRKTGFLGFLNCIEALKQLYVSLIESNVLIYLPFYKLSQDHIELLFCNIRSHGGSNNNPTARQFISAYKKMLVHVELKDTDQGNCTALEQLSILNCSSAEERINKTSGLNTSEDDSGFTTSEDSDYTESDFEFSDFSYHAIVHIAGYIVNKIIKSINCNICVTALVASKDTNLHRLILVKDKGGLQYPSKDVIRICQVAEKHLKSLDGGNIRKEALTVQILRQFVGSSIFDDISDHQLGEFPASNHVTDLIKAVIMRYLNVRIHHLLKLRMKISKRQLLNKYVLFQGQ